jgi:RNA-splicing ligase RtcB
MTKRKRKPKDPAAVQLGSKGGKKRAKNMSKAARKESARRAVMIRWERERMKAQKDGEL